MGWKYIPGCNIARGADGDNNKNQFGLSRKKNIPSKIDLTSNKHPYRQPIGTSPYPTAFNSARPLPLAHGLAKPPSNPLRVKKGQAGGMAVKLNAPFCPEIDVVAQLAKGMRPSQNLQFTSPDLFPPLPSGEGKDEPYYLHYLEPVRLVNSASLHKCPIPSIPWRYAEKGHDFHHKCPITQIDGTTSQIRAETPRRDGNKQTCDVSCQTVCEAQVQTDNVPWQWDIQNHGCQEKKSSTSSIFSSQLCPKNERMHKSKKLAGQIDKSGHSCCKCDARKLEDPGHKYCNRQNKKTILSTKRKVAKKGKPCKRLSCSSQLNDQEGYLGYRIIPTSPKIPARTAVSDSATLKGSRPHRAPMSCPASYKPVHENIELIPDGSPQPRSQLMMQPILQGAREKLLTTELVTSNEDMQRSRDTSHPILLPPAVHVPCIPISHTAQEKAPTSAKCCQTSKSWLQSNLDEENSTVDSSLPAEDCAAPYETEECLQAIGTRKSIERNSLDSLEELEKLIEEQHQELVARGILPPDEDDLGLPPPLLPHSDCHRLDKKLLNGPYLAEFGEQQNYNRECLSEIDDLEQRAEASRRLALPEKLCGATIPENPTGTGNQASEHGHDNSNELSDSTSSTRSHRSSVTLSTRSPERHDAKNYANYSMDSMDSIPHFGAGGSTNCTDTDPNSSEVAEMVASAAATVSYESMRENPNEATTYSVNVCKKERAH